MNLAQGTLPTARTRRFSKPVTTGVVMLSMHLKADHAEKTICKSAILATGTDLVKVYIAVVHIHSLGGAQV